MKRSLIFHNLARVVGMLGGLALIGAWIAGESGKVLGLSQPHLYNDAITLTLISIASLICAMIYLYQEHQR